MVAVCNFWLWCLKKMKNGCVTGSTGSLETSTAPPNMTASKMSDFTAVKILRVWWRLGGVSHQPCLFNVIANLLHLLFSVPHAA